MIKFINFLNFDSYLLADIYLIKSQSIKQEIQEKLLFKHLSKII